jgi:hypothetical protein
MASIEKFGKHPESGRAMFLLEIDSLDDWPEDVSLPKSRHFVLFLAADASDLSDEDVAAFAERALDQGMVYLSTWGRDSERVHDVFEEAAAEWAPDADADDALLSEWHEDEPLSEALRFSVASASPAHAFEKSCKATLVAVVGDPDAAEMVRGWLQDPGALDAAAEEGETAAVGAPAEGDEEEEEEEEDGDDDEGLDLDDDEDEEEEEPDEDDEEEREEDD